MIYFILLSKFSSQIISKTRKTCRRTKGNLLPLLQESPQVFGIARLSEVTTIHISHQKNPKSWVEQAKKEQSRDSRALSKGKGGVAGLFAGSVPLKDCQQKTFVVLECTSFKGTSIADMCGRSLFLATSATNICPISVKFVSYTSERLPAKKLL